MKLTTEQETALLLDFQGHTHKESAEIVGRSTRAVKGWARSPQYQEQLLELQKDELAASAKLVAQARKMILLGVEKAVKELTRTVLNANDTHGRPAYSTRIEAAKLLLEHAQKVGLGLPAPVQGNDNASHPAVIVIRDDRERPAPLAFDAAPPVRARERPAFDVEATAVPIPEPAAPLPPPPPPKRLQPQT